MIAQYCTYLLVDQLSWPNDLVFKRYILKCALPCALILIIMTSEISQLVRKKPEHLDNSVTILILCLWDYIFRSYYHFLVEVTFKYCKLSRGRTIVTSNPLIFVGTCKYFDVILRTGINAADPNLSWSWYLHTCTGLPKCSISYRLTGKSHKTLLI